MGDIVDDILDMFKENKPFKITMSCPDRTQAANEPNAFRTPLLNYCTKPKIKSELEYAEEYKKKDDEEYLKVVCTFTTIHMQ